jgi:concanavalin A-like lectin/glucanase superfamily protein
MKRTQRTLLLMAAAGGLLGAASAPKGLTFHASFDGSTDAAFALGDKAIYFAPSYKEQASAKPGLGTSDVELARGQGRKGDALRFKKKNTSAIFYRGEKNVAFDSANWSGTVSFWLSLDPETDLEPGFCDPIQVTDKAFNDSAIWVDFTKDDKPRHFRLGVFGELKTWNPQNVPPDKNPAFMDRLIVVKQPPFARGKWTHVAITFDGLGKKGSAKLYLDGKLQGSREGITEPFQWDMSKSAIRLGVNYTGLMDDVMVFRRPLSAKEIASLEK